MAVLEVHVPDAIAVVGERAQSITSPVGPVPRVEAETEEVGIREVQQARDLRGSFDEAGAMVMEDGAQACLVSDRPSDLFGALGKTTPLLVAQTHLRLDAPGCSSPDGVDAVVVSKDDKRRLADLGDQLGSTDSVGDRGFMGPNIGERRRDEGPHHFQGALPELTTQSSGLRRHERPVSELRAGKTSCAHLVEHPLESRGLVGPFELQDSPGTRGVGDFDHHGLQDRVT